MNLAFDKLMEQARRVGKHKSKKSAVTAALAEYVQRRQQFPSWKHFGSFEFDAAYAHKAERTESDDDDVGCAATDRRGTDRMFDESVSILVPKWFAGTFESNALLIAFLTSIA